MPESQTQSTFPEGGAVFTSPADVGTASMRVKPKKNARKGAFPKRDRDTAPPQAATTGREKKQPAAETPREASQRKPGDPMSDAEVQSAVWMMLLDAVIYCDGELSPQRAKLADLYAGKSLGNEEDGRSQFVMTIVRDTVKRIIPSLLRVFIGAEQACEFTPRFTKDAAELAKRVEIAEQMTEYVTACVIQEDNRGFQTFHEWFMDALIKNIGVVKWWTDDSYYTRSYKQSGMTKEQIETLDQDEEVMALSWEEDENAPGYYECEFVRRRMHKVQRFACLPPEEYLFTRGARTTTDDASLAGVAVFVAHRTLLTRSQLSAAGVSDEDIEQYAFRDATLDHNVEEIARQSIVKPEVAEAGPVETRKALYVEAFPYMDVDGDGIAELRRVVMLGPSYMMIANEPWDERPFAVICPDPQPHTIIGFGVGDYTHDLQKVMTMVARAALDSLALSVNPRVGYVEGEVSLEDLLNNDVGAPIRMTAPGMIEPVLHTFVGKDAIDTLMTFFEQVLENRVGVSKDTAGLNPESLQSTTAVAITSAVSAAQQHIEMIARMFAEMGMKPLMKGLLREVVKHPSPGRVMRFRGDYIATDPRTWEADVDVRVNVAIGAGLDAEKLDFIVGVVNKQEQLLQQLGPSPLVDFQRYAKTLIKAAKTRGRMDASEFFGIPPANWAPQPRPDPEQKKADAMAQHLQIKSQSENARAQSEVQKRQAETQSAAQKAAVEAEIAREKAQSEMAVESQRLNLEAQAERMKHASALQKIRDEHQVKLEELRLQGELDQAKLKQEMALAREKHDQEMSLQRDKHEHEKKLGEKRVENEGKTAEKTAEAGAGEKSVRITIAREGE